MMPVTDCLRLLDAALEYRRSITDEELRACARTARWQRSQGYREDADVIEESIRELREHRS